MPHLRQNDTCAPVLSKALKKSSEWYENARRESLSRLEVEININIATMAFRLANAELASPRSEVRHRG